MPLPGALGSARGSSERVLSPTRCRELSCSRSSERGRGPGTDPEHCRMMLGRWDGCREHRGAGGGTRGQHAPG